MLKNHYDNAFTLSIEGIQAEKKPQAPVAATNTGAKGATVA